MIVILSDDQGWGDLSLNGNKDLVTPHIDSLARDGASFDRFYVCPVCSPTRAEFLTGRYSGRCNVTSTSSGNERIDLDEMIIAETFRAAGYATAAFGKWHNGMQAPYHPNTRGFDEYYGFCSGHWGHYFSPLLERNGKLVRGAGYLTDDFTNHTIDFATANASKPFFIYLALNTPHSPMQVPDRWWDKFKGKQLTQLPGGASKNLDHARAALAMCENIDWNVGRLLKKLDDLQLADDTIVCYFCDNGPNGWRFNGGMKGRKGSTDEGGVRSPLLVRWPHQIERGTVVKPLGAAIDLLPTLADLAGIKVVSKKPLDGKSLKPLLVSTPKSESERAKLAERMIFNAWKGRVSVRTPQFRLDHSGKLYDMQRDPGQKKDVKAENPEIHKGLVAAVSNWKQEMAAESSGPRPFTLGHAGLVWTQLPARDATVHGGIQRSNRFPNCSYFTNWTSTKDSLTWELEVGAAGNYEVEVYYTCGAQDLGATLELSLGDSKVTAQVTESHDPPPVGAKQDRSKRGESYVKSFKPLTLGTMYLDKGKGTLTLRATEIPGKQALDFRLLMFRRLSR